MDRTSPDRAPRARGKIRRLREVPSRLEQALELLRQLNSQATTIIEAREEDSSRLQKIEARFKKLHALLQEDERLDPAGLDPWTQRQLAYLIRTRSESQVFVDVPLVLISQIQRSGGTLLSQLFDGHPSCFAHPSELHLGQQGKLTWPELDLDQDPDDWFDILRERRSERLWKTGYAKPGVERLDVLPFLLPPAVQRRFFMEAAGAHEIASQRDVLNCYMTSYFNAWLDNQNLHGGEKRWITAFAARTAMAAENRAGFFRDYPDGRLIGIVRDPLGWYASASRYLPRKYSDVDTAIELWKTSTQALIDAKTERGEAVYVLPFSRLVESTEDVMRELTDYLGIPFDPVLTVPTFNRMPIRANSSFDVESHGVLRAPSERGKVLDKDVSSRIASACSDLHEQGLALAGS